MPEITRITQSDILARPTWTSPLLKLLLGEPDRREPYQYGRKRGTKCMYALARVEVAESRPEFLAAAAKQATPKENKAAEKRKQKFQKLYATWRDALPRCCELMHSLNRYVKHPSCSGAHKNKIYDLKNQLIELLYREGYHQKIEKHHYWRKRECFGCYGTGIHFASGKDCHRCGNKGEYGEPTQCDLVCFELSVAGVTYQWHQPANTVSYIQELPGESTELSGDELA